MSFLRTVTESSRRDVEEAKQRVPLDRLQFVIAERRRVRSLGQTTGTHIDNARDFAGALRTGSPAILAEIKRASPSAGPITDANPSNLARAYERAGASAISVVTEPRYFRGSLGDLVAARQACSLPVLRKDFIVDPYQVMESAAAGADAVLLIATALDPATLRELRTLAESLDMCALVEIHSETEADFALAAGATLIGINNRDLNTLEVDLSTALRVREALPRGVTVVAESGYQSSDQLREVFGAGFDAVLVGESLLRAADPTSALRALRGVLV